MQSHDTDILQQNLIHSDLLNISRRKPNDKQASIPSYTLGTPVNHAHGIINDIHASLIRRQILDYLRPLLILIIDRIIRTIALRHVELMLRARGSDHSRPERLRDLHRSQSHPARRRMHQHPVPSLHLGAHDQRAVRGRRRDEEARGVGEAPARGHRLERLLPRGDFRGVAALRGAEDFVADFVLGRAPVGERGGRGEDDAGEFRARYPGEGGLVLVFARDLEEVEEVGCGCVDGYQVLIRRGNGIWKGGDLEFLWTLDLC